MTRQQAQEAMQQLEGLSREPWTTADTLRIARLAGGSLPAALTMLTEAMEMLEKYFNAETKGDFVYDYYEQAHALLREWGGR